MIRPEAERRFLRFAQQEGFLKLEDAVELVERLEELGLSGLQALRDIAIKTRVLSEKNAYRLFQAVSKELRAVPDGIAKIGGYEVLERIGRGSMGVVYKARQVSLGKEVALKVLPPKLGHDPLFVERFLREARAAARLNHPNIVQALDVGYADGFHFFAMELVAGSSMKEIVETRGPIEEREALKVCFFTAKALKHAHDAGIIHRDVKPANVMITSDGRVKLTDLGLARVTNSTDCSLTQHGKSVGTPFYMSPEQAIEDRPVDKRCDIYALGCTLFYALTGRPPYDGPTPSAILAKHVSAPIPDARAAMPGLSENASRLIQHMMAKRPETRPQTMRDVYDVLRAILQRPNELPAALAHRPGVRPAPAPAGPKANQSNGVLDAIWVGPSLAQEGVGVKLAASAATARTAPVVAAVAAPPRRNPTAAQPSGARQRPVSGAQQRPTAAPAPAPQAASQKIARKTSARRMAPNESSVSLMELQPVSSQSVRRLRRAVARRPLRGETKGSSAAAFGVGALVLGVAALGWAFAVAGGSRSASAEVDRSGYGRSAVPQLAGAHPDRVAPASPSPKIRGGLFSQEAADRQLADEGAHQREASAAGQPPVACDAKSMAAGADKLVQAARAEKAAGDAKAQSEIARAVDEETAKHRQLLSDLAPRIAAGRMDEALALAEQAAGDYKTEKVRARAERDAAGIRAALGSRALALEALATRLGKRESLALRAGTSLEGEISEVSQERGTITVRLSSGGTFEIKVAALADQAVGDLIRSVLGFRHPPFLLDDGLRLAYAGDLLKGRALIAQAVERGVSGSKDYLARVDELCRDRGLDPSAAPSPEPAIIATPPKATAEGDDEPRSGSDEPTVALTESVLLRLFENKPAAFTSDGKVIFRYVFLNGQKQLGGDFEVQGGEVRWDPSISVLKLEGDAKRATHRAVFAGDVKVCAEVVYMSDLGRQSMLEIALEDVKTKASSAVESVFGIALADRRKGKVAAIAGPTSPLDVWTREMKTYASYEWRVLIEGSTATTMLDGANRGTLEGLQAGDPRRVVLAWDHVNAQLRELTIEGRLDMRWVTRELARRAATARGPH